jgi:hypothetical protein
MPHTTARRAVLCCFVFSSFCVFGSWSQLLSAEQQGPAHQSNFGVEVKGPASQMLHKQALEYMARPHGDSGIEELAQFGSSSPPSKGVAHKDHASVLSVAIYTLLMACATVSGLALIGCLTQEFSALIVHPAGNRAWGRSPSFSCAI